MSKSEKDKGMSEDVTAGELLDVLMSSYYFVRDGDECEELDFLAKTGDSVLLVCKGKRFILTVSESSVEGSV
jgi:hypothetical protein